MVLENFNVKLERLTEDKIELVRKWRNNPDVQKYMEYREEITPQMQKEWFKRINNEENYFFLILLEDIEIGLVNLKDINYKFKTAEKGSLIWSEKLRGKGIGLRANYLLLDFAFNILNLEYIYIHILENNFRSIHVNEQFGFILDKDQEEKYNKKYILTKNTFLNNKERILRIIKKKMNYDTIQ